MSEDLVWKPLVTLRTKEESMIQEEAGPTIKETSPHVVSVSHLHLFPLPQRLNGEKKAQKPKCDRQSCI